jgi:DNA-binding response OmpR family regulator
MSVRILIVEDEPVLAEALEYSLTQQGVGYRFEG